MKPSKPVFGAQHPPWTGMQSVALSSSVPLRKNNQQKQTTNRNLSNDTSFDDYAVRTQDAWNMDEDDLGIMGIMGINQSSKSNETNNKSTEANIHKSQPKQKTNNKKGHVPRKTGLDSETKIQRLGKFEKMLAMTNIDLELLRDESWHGVPPEYRPQVWKILCGYLPPALDRRSQTLERKRQEYYNMIVSYDKQRTLDEYKDIFRQIHIDIPRMSPLVPIFQQDIIQKTFERILFIWAIRNPGSGYVQGINDLLIPYFLVFCCEYVDEDVDLFNCNMSDHLNKKNLLKIEADCYWCYQLLLGGIQDNYTYSQPGIQRKVARLKEIISRVDDKLHKHLCSLEVEFLQFSFRWMNNLLIRELPIACSLRLWDTYLAETNGFANFHVYVCVALLLHYSNELLAERDFQGSLILLQNLPTRNWTEKDIKELLAKAFSMKYTFDDAPNHLKANTKSL